MSTLFEKLIKTETLHNSWKAIKAKNKGGGIDGVSIEAYDAKLYVNITKLSQQLKNGNWKPQPYLKISIPKKNNEMRELGIMSINDKIVQHAIKSIIEPIFEKRFESCSYGYRPSKGTVRCIRRASNEISNKKQTHIIKFDIDNYFDTIDRTTLDSMIKEAIPDFEICRLIDLSIQMGVVAKNKEWKDTSLGVPQGAVLSPLLANLYLDHFDKYLKENNVISVRYADDFIIVCDSESQANNIVKQVEIFLASELKLKLNPSKITTTEQGVEFLGIRVGKGNHLSISESKNNAIESKIKSIAIIDGAVAPKSLQSIEGLRVYYGQLMPHERLNKWDELLINRLENLFIDSRIFNEKKIKDILYSITLFVDENNLNKSAIATDFATKMKAANSNIDKSLKQKNKKLIASRKLEYHKRESDGSDLVINSFGCALGLHNNMVVVKKSGKVTHRASANLKHITILSDGVSLSSNAIKYCSEKSIPIDFFDSSFKHQCTLISERFMRSNNWSAQTSLTQEQNLQLAIRILTGKIRNHLNLIKYFHKYHKGAAILQAPFDNAISKISSILIFIKDFQIPSNEKYQVGIQALEAQAAVLYWEYIRQLLVDDDIDFETREHKGASDLMNSMLNYGYALIYPRVWQAILAQKLNPYIGVIHYQSGKPALLFDIIELFRAQAVERVVISLIQRGEPLRIEKGKLSPETKLLLTQNIFERLYRYEKYRGKEMRLDQIIMQQVVEVSQYITDGKTYRPYIAKW